MNRGGGEDGERQEIEKDMGWRGGGRVKKKEKKRESRQGFMLSICQYDNSQHLLSAY